MAIRTYRTKKGDKKFQAQLWQGPFCEKSRSFSRKIDAERWLAEERLFRAKPDLRKNESEITLSDYFDNHFIVDKRCGGGTRQDYQRLFNRFVRDSLGDKSIAHLNPSVWTNLLTRLVNQGVSPARANRLRTMLSSLFSFAGKAELVLQNPISKVERFEEELSVRSTWSRNDVNKFFEGIQSLDLQWRTLFLLTYETGMRMGEIQALTRSAINFETKVITVCRTYSKHLKEIIQTTKGRKRRAVPISNQVMDLLQRYLETHNSELLFFDSTGAPLSQDQIRWSFHKACAMAGVKKIPFHSLRHSFASHFLMRGGGTLELKRLLGHARIETTERYTHLDCDHLASQVARMHLSTDLPRQ